MTDDSAPTKTVKSWRRARCPLEGQPPGGDESYGRSVTSTRDVPAKTRVLVISSEPIGPRLAGPAIRALELAGVLERSGHTPIVAAPAVHPDTPRAAFRVVRFEKDRAARVIGPLLREVEVVLL